MTGQKRKNSLLASSDASPPGSRKNSYDHPPIDEIPIDNVIADENTYVEDLLRYSARKFSFIVPQKKKEIERTILDDKEYFMSKKECDYGMCECCPVEKKLLTNWESIEEIIDNDPEIIFDSDDNPIVVEPSNEAPESVFYSGTTLVGSVSKKLPVFRDICSKISDSSMS